MGSTPSTPSPTPPPPPQHDVQPWISVWISVICGAFVWWVPAPVSSSIRGEERVGGFWAWQFGV